MADTPRMVIPPGTFPALLAEQKDMGQYLCNMAANGIYVGKVTIDNTLVQELNDNACDT